MSGGEGVCHVCPGGLRRWPGGEGWLKGERDINQLCFRADSTGRHQARGICGDGKVVRCGAKPVGRGAPRLLRGSAVSTTWPG